MTNWRDVWKPLAPNPNVERPDACDYDRSSIEANCEALDILSETQEATGLPLFGKTYDLTKWFRQLALADGELGKQVVHLDGGFRQDRRLQMGSAASAHNGQRVTFLLVGLLKEAADKGIKEMVAAAARGNADAIPYRRLTQ